MTIKPKEVWRDSMGFDRFVSVDSMVLLLEKRCSQCDSALRLSCATEEATGKNLFCLHCQTCGWRSDALPDPQMCNDVIDVTDDTINHF